MALKGRKMLFYACFKPIVGENSIGKRNKLYEGSQPRGEPAGDVI